MYCDDCLNAAVDEGIPSDDEDSTDVVLAEFGAEIADHLCDNVELKVEIKAGTVEKCMCACKVGSF